MIAHVVLARFPDPADAQEAERLLRTLPGKVDVIRTLSIGQDVIRSERSYDLGWIVEVDSLDDLNAYSEHPDHREVAAWIAQHRSDIAVCDFER